MAGFADSALVPGAAILVVAALWRFAGTGAFDAPAATGIFTGNWVAWALVAVGLAFIARAIGDFNHVGLFKAHRHTAFARNDSRYYSPLCLVLGAIGVVACAARLS